MIKKDKTFVTWTYFLVSVYKQFIHIFILSINLMRTYNNIQKEKKTTLTDESEKFFIEKLYHSKI